MSSLSDSSLNVWWHLLFPIGFLLISVSYLAEFIKEAVVISVSEVNRLSKRGSVLEEYTDQLLSYGLPEIADAARRAQRAIIFGSIGGLTAHIIANGYSTIQLISYVLPALFIGFTAEIIVEAAVHTAEEYEVSKGNEPR